MDGTTLRERMVFLWCSLILLPAGIAAAATFEGKVIAVLDGDTIEVLRENKQEHIRLYGIDCPEKWQPFGQQAKQATSTLLFGKDVKIETHGRDKHRWTLGTVFQGEVNVNHLLVKEGWCWWFSKLVPKDAVLRQFEQEAKEAKKGLWADPNPTPPWLYRRLDAGVYP
jgi:endonuclease YncB( thermonuclease family)